MKTNIVPVAVFPSEANVLYIRSITLGPPPAYYYELQNVTVLPDNAPSGEPGDADYVPGYPGERIVTVLKNGNVGMTEEQWNNWSETVDDTEYQLDCISANLGLTRV
jgi:hypothetical protein